MDAKTHVNAPLEVLRAQLGQTFYATSELKVFEDQIVAIFNSPPADRARMWAELQSRWHLDADSVSVLNAYYSFLIFDGDRTLIGNKSEVFATIKRETLAYHLEKNSKLRERYDFYREQLGKLSVPEIAARLGISQSEVYREVRFFDLSIIAAFKDDLRAGEDQASRFIRHFAGVENRGVAWDRMLGPEREDALIVEMHGRDMTTRQMAEVLNKLADTVNPTDQRIRTDSSVQSKLIALGLTKPRRMGAPNISIEPYGPVKISGSLVPATVAEFIFDNRARGINWCAEQLGVTSSTLYSFIQGQHMEGIFKDLNLHTRDVAQGRTVIPTAKTPEQKLVAQNAAHDNVLVFIGEKRRLPVGPDEWEEALGTILTRYVGSGAYRPIGGDPRKLGSRLHDNHYQAYSGLLERARDSAALNNLSATERATVFEGLNKLVSDYYVDTLPLSQQQCYFQDLVLAFVAREKRLPAGVEWRSIEGFNYPRYFALDTYGPGKKQAPLQMYPNRYLGLLELKTRAQSSDLIKGLKPVERAAFFANLDKDIEYYRRESLPLAEQREAASQGYVEFIAREGRLPIENERDRALGMRYARFFGQLEFSGKENRLHDGLGQGYATLLAAAEASPLVAKVEPVKRHLALQQLRNDAEAETFDQMDLSAQRERLSDRLLYYLADLDQLPSATDFAKVMGIGRARYVGQNEYMGTGAKISLRIYKNESEALADLQDRARRSSRVPVPKLDKVLALLKAEFE